MSAKKENGAGSFTQLKSGSYRYRDWVQIGDVRQRKSFTATSKTKAKQLWKDYCASNEKVVIEKAKTVSQWAEVWLDVYCKPKVAYGTYKDYVMYVEKHINPVIGNMKISEIRPARIRSLFANAKNKFGEPLSKSAQQKLKITLNGIFETAVDNKLCATNPVAKVSIAAPPAMRPIVFTNEQASEIQQYMKEHPYGSYIALFMYTGLRIGEVLGLMWNDIDVEQKVFNIRRALKRTESGKQVLPGTKNGKERIVPFGQDMIYFLNKIPRNGLFVVSRKVGKEYTHHTHSSFDTIYYDFFKDLNKHLEETKRNDFVPVPSLSPHKCRHTFATYMRKSGADLDVIKEILGHSTISITQIYDHVDTTDMRENIAKLKY